VQAAIHAATAAHGLSFFEREFIHTAQLAIFTIVFHNAVPFATWLKNIRLTEPETAHQYKNEVLSSRYCERVYIYLF
jgi:hypothetical protein